MAGLWDALKQYIGDALPGGALNPETQPVATQANYLSGMLDPASQVSQDAQAWHKRTQNGLMDQLAGRDTPEAEQAYQTMMQAAGMAPVGMIAWHGSPHKFDKFSLDKIGTGEGAQAYGHGLYLAESPEVANQYRVNLSYDPEKMKVGGKQINAVYDSLNRKAATLPPNQAAPIYDQMDMLERLMANDTFENVAEYAKGLHPDAQKWLHTQVKPTFETYGHTYKTDIPDEAVARFLDWDKSLAEQPEAMKAVKSVREFLGMGNDYWNPGKLATGRNEYQKMADKAEAYNVSELLRQRGIPGIRYLDGGSRGTGTGTSNFVAFDPEMIRILERNGQPTGLQPWKPGEWKR